MFRLLDPSSSLIDLVYGFKELKFRILSYLAVSLAEPRLSRQPHLPDGERCVHLLR